MSALFVCNFFLLPSWSFAVDVDVQFSNCFHLLQHFALHLIAHHDHCNVSVCKCARAPLILELIRNASKPTIINVYYTLQFFLVQPFSSYVILFLSQHPFCENDPLICLIFFRYHLYVYAVRAVECVKFYQMYEVRGPINWKMFKKIIEFAKQEHK